MEIFKIEYLIKVFDFVWGNSLYCYWLIWFNLGFFFNFNKLEIRNSLFIDIELKLFEDDVFFIKIFIGICLKL